MAAAAFTRLLGKTLLQLHPALLSRSIEGFHRNVWPGWSHGRCIAQRFLPYSVQTGALSEGVTQEPSCSSVKCHRWDLTLMQCFRSLTLNNAKWLRLENQRVLFLFLPDSPAVSLASYARTSCLPAVVSCLPLLCQTIINMQWHTTFFSSHRVMGLLLLAAGMCMINKYKLVDASKIIARKIFNFF